MHLAKRISIVWFRHDLRLDDHPALLRASQENAPVIPVFIWAPEDEGGWPLGAASRYWLHASLRTLAAELRGRGSRLILRQGNSASEILRLARETGARRVLWNRRCEPAARDCERRVTEALQAEGIDAVACPGNLLRDPEEILTQAGRPYQVFTPYWKRFLASPPIEAPRPAPASLNPPDDWPTGLALDELGLEPEVDWAAGIRQDWAPGFAGAMEHLERFLREGLFRYPERRDEPASEAVSRLSPHLHYGEISVRRLWYAAAPFATGRQDVQDPVVAYQRQLVWREFAHQLLHHFPHTSDEPLKKQFRRFDWKDDAEALKAWQRGRTGYPIVDAGMRRLWATGWMHNRLRMIVASFLVKDLRQHWLHGARWFWDTLVDADLANNSFGWQWAAGCGADAAPYFRIFNPVRQGRRFDPEGRYVKRWIPELSRLPARFVHQPWTAPRFVLDEAGLRLGRDYPEPIVDHARAREEALEAFHRMRRSAS